KLAHAAWSICVAGPRSGLTAEQKNQPPWEHETGKRAKRPKKIVEASATIEFVVARALGLSREHLQAIYDLDRSDRRGFWRYFDAEPTAHNIVKKVFELMRKN